MPRSTAKWLVARVVLPIVMTLACGTSAFAQVLPDLHAGARVRLRAPTFFDGRLTGRITSRSGDAFVVAGEHGSEYTIPISALTAVEVSGGVSRSRGAIKGGAWGAGLGLGVGLVMSLVPTSHDGCCFIGPPGHAELIVGGTGVGAAVGAFFGTIAGSERWDRLRIPESIALFRSRRGLGARFSLAR